MPVDKSNTTNPPAPSRPFMPTLASSRTAVKSPITPRLAVQHLKATTSPSLSVKSPRSDVSTPRNIRSPTDDCSTPARSILGNNITPRSANRKSRIETTHSSLNDSPVTTPITARATPAHDASTSRTNSALGFAANAKRPRSVVDSQQSGPSPLVRPTQFSPNPRQGESSPRDLGTHFFLASDAKPQEPTPTSKKAPTFFYANGQRDEVQPLRSPRAPSPTLSSVTTRSQKSQFYRADGTLEDDTLPPLPAPRTLNNRPEVLKPSHPLRPPSPQKADLHLTYRKGASQIVAANGAAKALLTPSGPRSQSPKHRPITIDPALAGSGRGHTRAGSLSSIDTGSSSRKSSLTTLDTASRHVIHAWGSPTSAPAGPRMPLPPTSNPLPLDILNEALSRRSTSTSDQSRPHSTSISSLPQSPTQPQQQQVPNYFAEAAANARRERKVLDLEISNSSLLAINRQLEREVRRQKTELRRFRRLSRAGRFSSIGSMMHPIQAGDDSMMESGADPLSDLSESDDEGLSESEEDPDSSLSDESIASSSLSPDALAVRDAARLAKDEKRLHLDLTRHRQLLVDSQKMNQSLKRCMAWSEEMIAEGRRALDYKVRVSDIELGGRVLEHEELSSLAEETESHFERGAQGRRGLLGAWSPPDGVTPVDHEDADEGRLLPVGLGIDSTASNGGWTLPGAGERDSGVHVDDEQFPTINDSKSPTSDE